jgi:hypothetical protein
VSGNAECDAWVCAGQAEQALGEWGAAVRAARAAPAAERPAPAAWLQGPHALRLAAIEDLALGRAEAPQMQLALASLQARPCLLQGGAPAAAVHAAPALHAGCPCGNTCPC